NIQGENYIVFNPNGSFNERNSNLNLNMQFRNTANLNMGISQNEVQLLYPISFTGQTPLPAGAYSYSSTFVNYKSDFRKPFSFFGNI
ncbi:hypothetical protein ABTE41_19420, partial [Acinetobacter baumannii]